MKKTVMTIAAATMLTLNANAEGYQVNTLSAKQNGMGHTGVALKLGAESQIFNPAGMGWMDKTIDFTASVSPIFSYVTATIPDGKKYETDNDASTPMAASFAFSINDKFKAGISLYTPYGSGINWTKNWPGAVLNQQVSLKVFTVQPTVAWRINEKLSVGAGLTVTWGNVNLQKGLVDAQAFDRTLQLKAAANTLSNMFSGTDLPTQFPQYGELCPASVELKGNAHPKFGVNVGIMYDINEKWSVGTNFRSEAMMTVKSGSASVNYADQIAETVLDSSLGYINENGVTFKASMPACAIWNVGASFNPNKRLTLAADLQFTHWKAYDYLDFKFTGIREETLADGTVLKKDRFDQHIKKNYRNTLALHLGAEYKVTDRMDGRLGFTIDQSPCDKQNYNPETPGQTRLLPSVGLSFRPIPQLSIDVAFIYVQGLGNKGCVGRYDNFLSDSFNEGLAAYNAVLANPVAPGVSLAQMLASQGITMPEFEAMSKQGTMKADYKLHAFIPSIGISVNF